MKIKVSEAQGPVLDWMVANPGKVSRYMSVLPPLPQGYEPHELPADYTGPLWIEGQLHARDLEVARVVLEGAASACGHLAQADAVAAILHALEVRHHE